MARWLEGLAAGGDLSRRSIQIFRMVLRAALDDAVATGELRRSPATRVGMPRQVVKVGHQRKADAWTEDALHRFLVAIAGHRWEAPLRLAVLYGLRRSELLAVRWSAVDAKNGTVRTERALVEVRGRPEWSSGKNARSRRTIPIDESMVRALVAHRRFQAEERLAAGHEWVDNDLVVATRTGTPVSPATSTRPSTGWSPRPEYRGSRRTASGTPQRRTWSATPATSARSAPLLTCWATVLTC